MRAREPREWSPRARGVRVARGRALRELLAQRATLSRAGPAARARAHRGVRERSARAPGRAQQHVLHAASAARVSARVGGRALARAPPHLPKTRGGALHPRRGAAPATLAASVTQRRRPPRRAGDAVLRAVRDEEHAPGERRRRDRVGAAPSGANAKIAAVRARPAIVQVYEAPESGRPRFIPTRRGRGADDSRWRTSRT